VYFKKLKSETSSRCIQNTLSKLRTDGHHVLISGDIFFFSENEHHHVKGAEHFLHCDKIQLVRRNKIVDVGTPDKVDSIGLRRFWNMLHTPRWSNLLHFGSFILHDCIFCRRVFLFDWLALLLIHTSHSWLLRTGFD